MRGVFLACVLCVASLHAVLDTVNGPNAGQALVIESTYTFTNGEYARGFVRFRNGFTIPGGVSATLDTHEPASGVLTINGTLNLAGDLRLSQGASIVTDGNGASSMTNIINLNGHTLILNDDLILNSWLNVFAASGGVIDGQSNRIVLPNGGARLELSTNYYGIQDSTTTITIRNVTLENLQGTNLQAPGYLMTNSPHTASITLNEVDLQVAAGNPFILTSENIHLLKDVDLIATGDSTITFSTGRVGRLHIHSGALFFINPGIPLQYSGDINPSFDDSSSVVHFDNTDFSWYSNNANTSLTIGNVVVDGMCTFARTGPSGPGGTITIGSGSPANDLYLYILPGSTLDVAGLTTLVYANSV